MISRDVIRSIEPVEEIQIGEWSRYEGWRIKTRLRKLFVLVSSESSCCENFGYISTDDNVEQFIGAELTHIEVCEANFGEGDVIPEYTKRRLEFSDLVQESMYGYVEAAFVYLETSRGPLTLAVYNSHNGYYGHDVVILQKGPGIEDKS